MVVIRIMFLVLCTVVSGVSHTVHLNIAAEIRVSGSSSCSATNSTLGCVTSAELFSNCLLNRCWWSVETRELFWCTSAAS